MSWEPSSQQRGEGDDVVLAEHRKKKSFARKRRERSVFFSARCPAGKSPPSWLGMSVIGHEQDMFSFSPEFASLVNSNT